MGPHIYIQRVPVLSLQKLHPRAWLSSSYIAGLQRSAILCVTRLPQRSPHLLCQGEQVLDFLSCLQAPNLKTYASSKRIGRGDPRYNSARKSNLPLHVQPILASSSGEYCSG